MPPDAIDSTALAIAEPRGHGHDADRSAKARNHPFRPHSNTDNPTAAEKLYPCFRTRGQHETQRQKFLILMHHEKSVGQLAERISIEERRTDHPELGGPENTRVDQELFTTLSASRHV